MSSFLFCSLLQFFSGSFLFYCVKYFCAVFVLLLCFFMVFVIVLFVFGAKCCVPWLRLNLYICSSVAPSLPVTFLTFRRISTSSLLRLRFFPPEMDMCTLWSSKRSSWFSFLSQVGAEWYPAIPPRPWEGIPPLRWHLAPPCLLTCPPARTQNPPTSRWTPNPTSSPSSHLQVRPGFVLSLGQGLCSGWWARLCFPFR